MPDKRELAQRIADIDVYAFRDAYDDENEGIEDIIRQTEENPWGTISFLLDIIDNLNA